jgi:hypothetical protein
MSPRQLLGTTVSYITPTSKGNESSILTPVVMVLVVAIDQTKESKSLAAATAAKRKQKPFEQIQQ